MIKSISYSQEEIIRDIISLHNNGSPIECDATFSKGVFWKNIGRPRLTFDLSPQDSETIQGDCRNLPLEDESISSLMIDLPFVISYGPSLETEKEGSNMISSRFSQFRSIKELYDCYYDSIKEGYRILKKGGIMVFKCQDTVSSGKQYIVHCAVNSFAEEVGFYVKDLFILLSKGRLMSGKWKRQLHARKFHSYLYVFTKK